MPPKENKSNNKIVSIEHLPEHTHVKRYNGKRVFLCYTVDGSANPFVVHDGDQLAAFECFQEIVAKKPNLKGKIRIARAETGVIDILLSKTSEDGGSEVKVSNSTDDKTDNVYQKDFLSLVGEAMDDGTSDVHFEIRRGHSAVRFRKHGKLRKVRSWSYEHGNRMCSVIFTVMSEAMQGVVFNPSEPQFALVAAVVDGVDVRLRVNSIPAAPYGYDVVIRILKVGSAGGEDANEDTLKVEDLGYNKAQQRLIIDALEERSGAMIIAGTTGSGKSTTLQTMLKNKIKAEPYLKIITIEDPVEYFIGGATQVPVARKEGANEFANTIKACMRCDPDILMIGETRDEETSELLQDAVLTGHKTFSTIHAGSAITVISRLERMGVERMIMATKGFISVFMFQALSPVLCQECKLSIYSEKGRSIIFDKFGDEIATDKYEYWENTLKEISEFSQKPFNKDNICIANNKDNNCSTCSGSGIVGMTVVAEVMAPSVAVLEHIANGNDFLAFKQWIKDGGVPISVHACEKILDGEIGVIDAEHIVGPLKTALEDISLVDLNE